MPVLIASLVIGILFGVLLHRLFGKNSGNPEWQQEKEAMEEELRRYREQVNNHFSTSAELFQRLNDSYRDLLKHMADGTQELEVELPARLKHDINQIAALNNKPDQPEDDNISISPEQMAAQSTSPDSTVAASAMQTEHSELEEPTSTVDQEKNDIESGDKPPKQKSGPTAH